MKMNKSKIKISEEVTEEATQEVVEPIKAEKPDTPKKRYGEILVDEVALRKYPSWDNSSKCGLALKGDVFEVKAFMTVGGGKMYQLNNGLYISASTSLVRTYLQ